QPRDGDRAADLRQARPRRPRGHRRGIRVARVRGVRPGGEPDAHHQGPHDRHPRPAVMRVVAALGGNALLERGEKPDADIQEHHVQQAVAALAPVAAAHELIVTHGNGPHVGLRALESARDPALTRPYALDALGAQTQGMIGYWLARALRGAAPGKPAACLVSQTRVDAGDPAFGRPTKFIGPVYQEKEALDLAAE